MVDEHLKRCTKCSTEQHPSQFSRDLQKKDGLRSHCKSCDAARGKVYRVVAADSIKAHNASVKHRTREQALAACRKWQAANREKTRLASKRWREANPEKAYLSTKRYRANNVEKERETARLRRLKDPAKFRTQTALRRARVRGAEGSFTAEDVQDLLRLQRGKCVSCRTDITQTFTIDHIVPLSKGGRNTRSNLQLMCHKCNCSKWNRDSEDFMRKRGFLL